MTESHSVGRPRPAVDLMPAYRPGVYVLNAFSGNVWFGSTRVDPGRTQRPLISQIDPNYQWALACGANLLIADPHIRTIFSLAPDKTLTVVVSSPVDPPAAKP